MDDEIITTAAEEENAGTVDTTAYPDWLQELLQRLMQVLSKLLLKLGIKLAF